MSTQWAITRVVQGGLSGAPSALQASWEEPSPGNGFMAGHKSGMCVLAGVLERAQLLRLSLPLSLSL